MVKPTAANNQDGPEAIPAATRPTISYYLVLALVVIPLYAVTPASWCYVAYSLYTGAISTFAPKQWAFFVVALAEVRPLSNSNLISDGKPCERIHPGVFQRIPL